jgi:hypothetical protein
MQHALGIEPEAGAAEVPLVLCEDDPLYHTGDRVRRVRGAHRFTQRPHLRKHAEFHMSEKEKKIIQNLQTSFGDRIRIWIHQSEVRVRIRIFPFLHKCVERTEIMLAKK